MTFAGFGARRIAAGTFWAQLSRNDRMRPISLSATTEASVKPRIVALAFIAAAQPAWTSQLRSDAEIRNILAERLKGFEKSVSSIIVGVIGPEGRRVVAHGSMGMTDRRPVNGDTLYEIGSITKVFTSLLLADMVERGEVTLDDRWRSVCRSASGCPNASYGSRSFSVAIPRQNCEHAVAQTSEVLWTSTLLAIAIGQATLAQHVARFAPFCAAACCVYLGSTIEVRIVPATDKQLKLLTSMEFGGAARI